MTTLPLLWAEAEDVGQLLQADQSAGWVRAEIERRHTIAPLDVLDDASLRQIDRLLLAQPRALSPEENVALDGWVRRGGRLLLFADPMLTFHSRYAIGDRRRPQDVVLLSPILKHWGLELRFDPDGQRSERTVDVLGVAVPVDMPGIFHAAPGSRCTVLATGLASRCRIGEGTVFAIADAAVLEEPGEANTPDRHEVFQHLIAIAFDQPGISREGRP